MFLRRLISRRTSFAFRLAAACALLFGLLSVGGVAMLYLIVRTHVIHTVDQAMELDMRELCAVFDHDGMQDVQTFVDALMTSEGTMDGFYRILDAHGSVLFESKFTAWHGVDFDPGRLDMMDARAPLFRNITLPDARHEARVLDVRIDEGRYLQIGVSLEDHTRFLFHLRSAASILILVMLAGGTAIGWLIARRAMSGIRRITRTIEQLEGGDFGNRVPPSLDSDEIAQLGRTFNLMAERVQSIMGEMRQTNSNIAHDLRSPVARIRGLTETTMLTAKNQDEFADVAGSVIEECDRLLAFINTTLDIAEAEAGVRTLIRVPRDLAEIAQEAVDIFQPVAEERGIRLQIQLQRARVFVELPKIQRSVANLIDNALKFTPPQGEIRVSVSTTSTHAVLAVRDTGPGIPEEDLPHVFERFYRGDQSRHQPGHGLGLSLASAFVHAHGGDIRVESSLGHGSTFTILLPLASDADGAT